jgi:hypothetical protein
MFGPTSFSFKGIVWKKVGIGALIAVIGALLTYGTSWIASVDFGSLTPLVVAVWGIIVNIARKWISDNE